MAEGNENHGRWSWVQGAGLLVVAIGLLCVPLAPGVSPKRDLSVFANLSDLGAFVWIALICIPTGLLIFGIGVVGGVLRSRRTAI